MNNNNEARRDDDKSDPKSKLKKNEKIKNGRSNRQQQYIIDKY